MEIVFQNQHLRDLCEKKKLAERKLGYICAKKLRLRLNEIRAASTVKDLAFGRPHPLQGKRLGEMALDLTGGYRLVFAPAETPIPTNADGSVDWSRVTIIEIEYIGDYHD